MSLFALGSIDPLLVTNFSGFDVAPVVQPVRLLSDGGLGPHEVLQSSGIPADTAQLTGTLTEDDCVFLRRYHRSLEVVTFTDGNGIAYNVRVTDLATEDHVHWWTFTASLYLTDDNEAPGS